VAVAGGSFTMSGGRVGGNKAAGSGGGITITGGTFQMNGSAEISSNKATNGGGVAVTGGSFAMSGGSIGGNNAISGGGGVYAGGGTFTKSGGGTIHGSDAAAANKNTSASGDGHAVCIYSSDLMPFNILNSTAGPAVNLDSTRLGTAGGWEPPEWLMTVYVTGGVTGGNGTAAAPFPTVDKALEAIRTAYAGNAWPNKGTSNADPARIIVSGTITTGGRTNGLVEIIDTTRYTTYPPIVLVGKGEETLAGTLDAGNAKRVLYIENVDVTLGENLTLTKGKVDTSGAAYGGGVYVTGGSFTMNGGTISNNTNTGYGDAAGGGVYVTGGSFTMSGTAVISGNTVTTHATPTINNDTAAGGGVYVTGTGASFTMSGTAVISGNKAIATNTNAFGGGVEVRGSFTMEGGRISGNEAKANAATVTTVTDTDPDPDLSITFGHASGGGVYVQNGTFTMKNNAEISDNEATATAGNAFGGGVQLTNHDSSETLIYIMEGGHISGNEATATAGDASGGGIRFSNTSNGTGNRTATFTMSGTAVISGNEVTATVGNAFGGGMYASNGSFTMQGGTISGNKANGTNTKTFGGGVYVGSNCIFTKTGDSVIYGSDAAEADKNTAPISSSGHAVCAYNDTIHKIRNNTAGTGVNLTYDPENNDYMGLVNP
jgi:hypothetical protein